MKYVLAFAIAIASFAAAPGGEKSAKPDASADSKLTIPFERFELANGLEVFLHQDHSAPLVAVNIWYHVGAFHERVGRTGFAHLFEHMMFQGSAHVRDDTHFRTLETIGASEINGTTSFDRTNYFETVPANHLETALWLESDRMGFLLNDLTQAKLTNQRGVVQNERRQSVETAPYGLAEERYFQALFPAPHPYFGVVLGSMKDLDAASLDDVRQFFYSWYAPNNATLVIAGDFDVETAKKLVEKYFGTIPRSPQTTPPVVAPVKIEVEKRIIHDEKIGKLPRVTVGWHSPAYFAQGDATADLLSMILASGQSSLLDKKLVRELGIAQSVSAYQQSMGAQSVFQIDVTGMPGVDPQKLLAATDAVLDSIRSGGITEEEVQRVLNRQETAFMRNLQKLGGFGGRADLLQTYNHFLDDPGFLAKDLERYRQVTAKEIAKFATDVLPPSRRVVLFAVPTDDASNKEVKP